MEDFNFDYIFYEKAVVDKDTGGVYYAYFNEKTNKYQRFDVLDKKNIPTENLLDVCKITNKALKRGYNPFKHGKKYEDIKKIGTQNLNWYCLFLVYLYRLFDVKLNFITADVNTIALCSFIAIFPIFMLIIYLQSILKGTCFSLENIDNISIGAYILISYTLVNILTMYFLNKRGHLHSDTGYVYYSEKYEGLLFFVLLGLIVLAIWSFISMII
jgi:hypothetical protein